MTRFCGHTNFWFGTLDRFEEFRTDPSLQIVGIGARVQRILLPFAELDRCLDHEPASIVTTLHEILESNGIALQLANSSPNTMASSIAISAPAASEGAGACAASPMSIALPRNQGGG